MLEEALKWVGPYPLVQLAGAFLILYLGIKSALKGMQNAEPVKAEPAEDAVLPDWFLEDCKEQQRNIQRILWVVEDINNKIEHLRGMADKSILPRK